MKRLLLVAYVFPPAPSPGALRPGYIARYLPQFGWEATVLTSTLDQPPFPARVFSTETGSARFHDRLRGRIVARAQDPESPLRKTLRAINEAVMFPDLVAPWIPAALRAGNALLEREHYDAILSTALPASVHVVGWMLAKKSGLPWIADYRDPWAGNAYLRRGPLRSALETWLERGMLRRATAIATISEPIAAQLRSFHRRRDVYEIPNAYDPADWEAIPNAEPKRFDLCFTGSMYNGKRSPDLFFAALAQLRAAGDPAGSAARVHFYGPNSEMVAQSASRFGLDLVVRQHGVVQRTIAMRAQRSAAALLIFLNTDPSTASEMGSKYLEYMGAHRPVIAFGPKDSIMRNFVNRGAFGWFAADVEEAKFAVREAYTRFVSGACEMQADTTCVPSARDLARRFADVLDASAAHSSLRSIA